MAMKNKDKVLLVMQDAGIPMERAEVVQQTGFDNSNVGTYLKRLIKDKHAQRIDYGVYAITEGGKNKADQIRKMYGKQSSLMKDSSPKENKLEQKSDDNILSKNNKISDIDLVMQIKAKYSNDKEMLRILKNLFK